MDTQQYFCTLDGDDIKCFLLPENDHIFSQDMINFCSSNNNIKLLIKYPRGNINTLNNLFKMKLEQYAIILHEETLTINKSCFNNLLKMLYFQYDWSHKTSSLTKKLNKTWYGTTSNKDNRQITFYLFELNNESQLRQMKSDIRNVYSTMHCLHTSDNQHETLLFLNYLQENKIEFLKF